MTHAIDVSHLSKYFKRYPSRWARFREWLPFHRGVCHEQIWALEDISFQVASGEAVGIVGVNGAGKSTLLKLITNTTQPSSGQIRISGRVSALLELGIGFHPELSGRDNVLFTGQVLGLTEAQVQDGFDEIIAFSELHGVIDQPIRTYSSGMQMRLAFSLATAVRPDILIIDEALSVGDAYFQHKSFERIRSFKHRGTTLLLVSHDKAAIQAICDRAILLHERKILKEGPPDSIMDFYNAMLSRKSQGSVTQISLQSGRIQTLSGTGEATIQGVQLLNTGRTAIQVVAVGEPVTLSIQVYCRQPIEQLVLGFIIKDRLGQPIFGTNTLQLHQPLARVTANSSYLFQFDFEANLGIGEYSISTALVNSDTHFENNYEWRDIAMSFSVINPSVPEFTGCSFIPVTCHISPLHRHNESIHFVRPES
jgi:lipopolysaccharide transport system ATP-binding protein